MKLRVQIPAPVETVWQALTDPAAMRVWLAEHVSVDLPREYRFWGRFTPPGAQVLSRVDGHSLSFGWLGTEVTITLEPDTVLTLTQTNLPRFGTGSGPLTLMHTYWALALANLADFVEGRPLTGQCDFTADRQRQEIPIAADPADVWHSLTDPETFKRWFGARMDLELHVGGRWAMGGFDLNPEPATITELEPGRKLTIDFGDLLHTWELDGSAGQTTLTVIHSGFGNAGHGSWLGWLGGLAELRRFHEQRPWRPLWLTVEVAGVPDGMLHIGHEENRNVAQG